MHPFNVTASPDSKLGQLGLGSFDSSGNRVLLGAGLDASVSCTGSLYRMPKHD
jgi:hypothetical protein